MKTLQIFIIVIATLKFINAQEPVEDNGTDSLKCKCDISSESLHNMSALRNLYDDFYRGFVPTPARREGDSLYKAFFVQSVSDFKSDCKPGEEDTVCPSRSCYAYLWVRVVGFRRDSAGAQTLSTVYDTLNTHKFSGTCTDVSDRKASSNLNKNNVSIYPNPSHGTVNIQSETEFDNIIILDIYGREIERIDLGTQINRHEINLGYLNNGMYNIVLLKEDEIINSKRFSVLK